MAVTAMGQLLLWVVAVRIVRVDGTLLNIQLKNKNDIG